MAARVIGCDERRHLLDLVQVVVALFFDVARHERHGLFGKRLLLLQPRLLLLFDLHGSVEWKNGFQFRTI